MQEEQTPATENSWQYRDEQGGEAPKNESTPTTDAVSWTASEYIAHEKSLGWFVLLGLAIVALAALVYLFTREIVSTVVILVIGVAFGGFAARPPQELSYSVDKSGVHIGNKLYGYGQFKSFTVFQEGAIRSISFMPLQRFMPPLSIYYAPEDEEKITTVLSNYLPYEERNHDLVDRLMRKIRF